MLQLTRLNVKFQTLFNMIRETTRTSLCFHCTKTCTAEVEFSASMHLQLGQGLSGPACKHSQLTTLRYNIQSASPCQNLCRPCVMLDVKVTNNEQQMLPSRLKAVDQHLFTKCFFALLASCVWSPIPPCHLHICCNNASCERLICGQMAEMLQLILEAPFTQAALAATTAVHSWTN